MPKNRVRYYRNLRFFTQDELGKLIGVQGQTIANIEKSKHKPRPKTARELAQALGVPIEELFPAEEDNAQSAKQPAA